MIGTKTTPSTKLIAVAVWRTIAAIARASSASAVR